MFNTTLVLFILLFMSASVRGVTTSLPRYANVSTSTRAVLYVRMKLLVLERTFITCVFAVLGVRQSFVTACESLSVFSFICVKGEPCEVKAIYPLNPISFPFGCFPRYQVNCLEEQEW